VIARGIVSDDPATRKPEDRPGIVISCDGASGQWVLSICPGSLYAGSIAADRLRLYEGPVFVCRRVHPSAHPRHWDFFWPEVGQKRSVL